MRAILIDKFGAGADGLSFAERSVPVPGPRQVLVRIRATSINYRDRLILAGLYPVQAQQGITALSDGAGEVVAVGTDVANVSVGERVATVYFPRWRDGAFSTAFAHEQYGCTREGVLADYVLADEEGIVAIPSHLSFEEAAALPCAGVTAWAALHGPRAVLAGETVLTIGSGGVALFVVQFAKLCGARVIVVTSAADKCARLQALGADDVVVRDGASDWSGAVRALTNGRGVDHIVETGSRDTLEASLAAAADNAVATIVAALGPGQFSTKVLALPITIRRTYVGSRAHFAAMNSLIGDCELKPVIDSVYSFAEARAAFDRFGARTHFGKVVISLD